MIKHENLTQFKTIALSYISACLADTFAENPSTDMTLLGGSMVDTILWRVKQPIWGEGPFRGPPIEYPANWKEAVKERFAPRWFKRRWPVKKITHRYNARILYPLISIPKEKHFLNVSVVTD